MHKMADLVKNSGSNILDNEIGKLIKDIGCVFYPTCLDTLGVEDTVLWGVVALLKDHEKISKLVYVFMAHKEELVGDDLGNLDDINTYVDIFASKDGKEELDDLESSVLEEEKEEYLKSSDFMDVEIVSQSLLSGNNLYIIWLKLGAK